MGRSTFAQGLHAARALLPDHSDRLLFAWSFLAFEVGLLKGELALRIERHEVGPTRRKDLFHQACFRFLAGYSHRSPLVSVRVARYTLHATRVRRTSGQIVQKTYAQT